MTKEIIFHRIRKDFFYKEKIMKKLLLLLVTTLALFAFVGCKGKGSGKVTLQLFHYKQEVVQGMNELVQAFNQKHPNITIETETIPNDAQTVLKARLVAGEAPDIMMLQAYSTVFEYAEAGYLLDVSNESFMKNVVDGSKTAVTYNNKAYALPLDMAGIGVIYNKDVFEKYGLSIPTTFAELQQVCTTLKIMELHHFQFQLKITGPRSSFFYKHTAR